MTRAIIVAASTTLPTSGSDTVIFNLGEAQVNGADAAFSVSINGTIVGAGTVTAAEAVGGSENFTYTGNFGVGPLNVAVTMLDGFTGNAIDKGRTLYVNSISVNGQANFENSSLQYDNPQTYALTASPAVVPTAQATSDTLTLNLSGTPLGGQDALFEVAVNGTLVSQPTLVTAAAGASQDFTFTGAFGSKATVTIDFINGFSGGAYGEALAVNSITLDGLATKENADLFYNGPVSYTVDAGGAAVPPTPVTPPTPTPPVTTPTPTPTPSTSGSDTVIFNLGEAQVNGADAAFSVSINGTIVGAGTVTAAEAVGGSENFTYTGNFGVGPLNVAVTMLDGFTGNAIDKGRTLYVNSISVNGQANFENSSLQYDNPQTYALTASPAVVPTAQATSDTLTLNLSGTPLGGQDALFEVAVNGTLVSQPTLVTAAAGASQDFTFTGAFGSKATVTIDFINGFSGGAYGEALAVNSITLDGLATKENADLFYNGPVSYTVAAGGAAVPPTPVTPPTPTPPVTTPTPTPTPSTSGSDTVIFNLGEAQVNGADAAFSVSINGTIVGTGTVTAAEAVGGSENFTYTGNFGVGPLNVAVTMLDGFTGNAIDKGRTLYVNSISVNGQANFENSSLQYDNPQTYALTASPAVVPTAQATSDTLTLNLSGTPLGGQDALFEVAVNGTLVSQPTLVTAAAGASQDFTFTGAFGSKATVTIDFINGFSGGAYGEALAVNSITLDGLATKENADLFYNGPVSYTVDAGGAAVPPTPVTPPTPTPPVTTPTPTPTPTPEPTTPTSPISAVNALPPADPASTSGVGTNSLLTYNWNPSTQLAHFIANSTGSSIAFVGDSTTLGFGGTLNEQHYVGTSAIPAEVTSYLNADGIATQDDNFEGQGNELGTTPDLRVTLVGGAQWSFPMLAGGELVATSKAGDGVTFTPLTPTGYSTAIITYLSLGGGTLDLSVNGGSPVAALSLGNSNSVVSQTIDLPIGTPISSITATQTGGTADYIQGIGLSGASIPAAQVYDLGVGGSESSIVGTGSDATGVYTATPISASTVLDPTVVFINYGINDMLQGNLTAAQTTANIGLMVEEYQAAGIEPVIVVPQAIDNPNYTSEIASLQSDIDALARQDNVPVIDLSATYGTNWQVLNSAALMSDYAHPNGTFYSDIGKGIAGLLAAAVHQV